VHFLKSVTFIGRQMHSIVQNSIGQNLHESIFYTSRLIERRIDKRNLQLRKAFLEAVQLF